MADLGIKNTKIDFNMLPLLEGEHAVVSLGDRNWRFRLHSYLAYFEGQYWCMWSQGRSVEDRHEQHVWYSTSQDGLNWDKSKILVHPGVRGFRYIARGFWIRNGELHGLVSYDEVGGYFGKNLELRSYLWHPEKSTWCYRGVVFGNTINNFPPKKLLSGEWMMARRDSNRQLSFLIGGTKSISSWEVVPFSDYKLKIGWLDEPDWTVLPDGNIVALFRDNKKSGYLMQSFSNDNGRSWTTPKTTNFPNTSSKFNLLHTEDYYVLVNNVRPRYHTLCLSVSNDGLEFVRMSKLGISTLSTGETYSIPKSNLSRGLFQYPHMIEHDESLLIVFSRRKQTVEVLKISLDKLDALI